MSLGTALTGAGKARPITGHTGVVGIIGDPVEHSLSPAMQNAAFQAARLDMVYVPFRVRRDELRRAVESLRALGILGVNVTVPHKQAVLPLLDSVSSEAKKLGAVNTIVVEGRKLVGHNTDARGFRASLKAARVRLDGKRALVIGAGGAARAIVSALLEARCARIWVVNRTPANARRLVHGFRSARSRLDTLPWNALEDASTVAAADLIVNCTSVGLHGEALELSYGATHARCVFADLVYGRTRTPFVARAQRLGRRTIDGTGMLIHQGALAFSLWTGRRAPLDTMRKALQAALIRKAGR